MVRKTNPVRIPVPGEKLIEEHVGLASTGQARFSVAHMVAPPGWSEPHQQPAFDEVTIVLRGTMRVEYGEEYIDVGSGEAVLVEAGDRVRYSNPFGDESEYWAICAPAFAVDSAGRE